MTDVGSQTGTHRLPGGLMRSQAFADSVKAARDDAAAKGLLFFDPFDPRFSQDPFSLYAELRESNPVHRSPLGFWVFTRHADCLAILKDKRSSSDARNVDPEAIGAPVVTTGPEGPAQQIYDDLSPFIFRDPPDHTRLRGLVQKAFTPRVVDALRDDAEQLAKSLVDDALEKGEVDLVADFAYALPVRIIAEMLGVPESDLDMFKGWSDALARGLDPDFLLPPEAMQERLNALISFMGYFGALISERRQAPGDDLLSKLIQAEENGVMLTQGELIATCILILVAGHETTVNLLSGGVLELMRHRDQMTMFRDDPSVLRSGVEEMLRFVSPVQLTGRTALEDMEVGDAELLKGEFAMLLLGSANRDPAVFEDPETFDVTRVDNPHIGLGFGVHHCLGASLARLEAHVALPELIGRIGSIELVTDELVYRENIVLRGLAALPVHITAA
jgi:cytochrome P450